VKSTCSGVTRSAVTNETTYGWNGEAWSVPVIFSVNQLLLVGGRPLQLGAGARLPASPNRSRSQAGFPGA